MDQEQEYQNEEIACNYLSLDFSFPIQSKIE